MASLNTRGNERSQVGLFWTIVILLVVVFTLGRWFWSPSVRAKWLIAYSAVEFQNGRPESARNSQESAVSLYPGIQTDTDYWKIQFDLLYASDKVDDGVVELFVKESIDRISKIDSPEERGVASMLLATSLLSKREFESGVEVLSSGLPPIPNRTAMENNLIAYLRALSKKNLEIGLEEINRALLSSQDAEIIDTKAWVLYQKGEPEKALEWIEVAIEKTYKGLTASPELYRFMLPDSIAKSRFKEILELEANLKPHAIDEEMADDASEEMKGLRPSWMWGPRDLWASRERGDESKRNIKSKQAPPVIPSNLNREPLFVQLKSIATIRFHRACILEALGRVDEAMLDYCWLDYFGFVDTKELI